MEKNTSNLFLVFMFTFLKTLAFCTAAFYLLLLMYSDTLENMKGDDWIFLVMGGGFGYFMFIICYLALFLMPVYFIDKQQILKRHPFDLFKRYLPFPGILSAIIFLITGIAAIVQNKPPENMFIMNLIVVTLTMYAGLFFFTRHFSKMPA